MKIYVSGKISGLKPVEYSLKFGYISQKLKEAGHNVINPVYMGTYLMSEGFGYEDIMQHCLRSIDICDAIYMLPDWEESPGAKREHEYAVQQGKKIIYDSRQ